MCPVAEARALTDRGGPNIREHLCIRRPEYVAGTSTRPEVGVFTQTAVGRKPVPWGRIGAGETVWMKWTGGPVVAKATVSGFRQLPDTTPAGLRQAVTGFALHELEAYWRALPPRFDGLAVYFAEETWLDEPLVVAGRSHRASWLVFANAAERRQWMARPSRATNGGSGTSVYGVSARRLHLPVLRPQRTPRGTSCRPRHTMGGRRSDRALKSSHRLQCLQPRQRPDACSSHGAFLT